MSEADKSGLKSGGSLLQSGLDLERLVLLGVGFGIVAVGKVEVGRAFGVLVRIRGEKHV